jgi:hypothetical protein
MVKSKNTLQLLTPILDIYKDEPIGIVGCNSSQISRDSCEYDILVVGEKNTPKTLKVGNTYFDVVFMDEKELLSTKDAETSLSLASMIIVRDTTFSLSTAYSFHRAISNQSTKKSVERRLALSLKSIARSEEALSRGLEMDSDFWLTYSSYNLAFSWILSKGMIPSPSHILEQTKKIAKLSPPRFQSLSEGLFLTNAGKKTCLARLQALSLIMDTLENTPSSSKGYIEDFELIKKKSMYLLENKFSVECFSYLGLKIAEYIMMTCSCFGGDEQTFPLNFLTDELKLISKDILGQFCFSRKKEVLGPSIDSLKSHIMKFAKTV